MGAVHVLDAIGRLQDAAAGTPLEATVAELVAAIAADTTAAELRQEIEFLKAEHDGLRPALVSLLEWAKRHRGGDPALDPEEFYVVTEYAKIVLDRTRKAAA